MSWIKFLKESTTFEEKIVNDQARLPSFTLCPTQPDLPIGDKSIESFEDIDRAIEHVRSSTCPLTSFFWLLSYVIYLKLTKVL